MCFHKMYMECGSHEKVCLKYRFSTIKSGLRGVKLTYAVMKNHFNTFEKYKSLCYMQYMWQELMVFNFPLVTGIRHIRLNVWKTYYMAFYKPMVMLWMSCEV